MSQLKEPWLTVVGEEISSRGPWVPQLIPLYDSIGNGNEEMFREAGPGPERAPANFNIPVFCGTAAVLRKTAGHMLSLWHGEFGRYTVQSA